MKWALLENRVIFQYMPHSLNRDFLNHFRSHILLYYTDTIFLGRFTWDFYVSGKSVPVK